MSFLYKSNRRKAPNQAIQSERKLPRKKYLFSSTISIAERIKNNSELSGETFENDFEEE